MWWFLVACGAPGPDAAPAAGAPCVSVVGEVFVGEATPGGSVDAAIEVRNACQGTLVVEGVSLASGGGPFDFHLPGAIALDGGDSAEILVSFAPVAAGGARDTLRIDTNDADRPRAEVALTGQGGGLRVEPLSLALEGWIGCEVHRFVTLENEGGEDVVITGVSAVGDASVRVQGIAAGDVILGNAEVALEVVWAPTDTSGVVAEVVITTSDAAQPEHRIAITGAGAPYAPTSESFAQWSGDQLDLLLVVDNSDTAGPLQERFAAAVPAFAAALGAADFRVGVIVADNPNLRSDPITAASDVEVEILEAALAGTSGDARPSPMDTAYDAALRGELDGFLREDAAFALLFLTSRAESATDAGIDFDLAGWRAIRPDPRAFRVHAIAGDVPVSPCAVAEPGVGFDRAVAATSGVFSSACEPTYDLGLAAIVSASIPDGLQFPLAAAPQVETLAVSVDGAPATGWSWDAARQMVVFLPDAKPASDATVTVSYGLVPVCEPSS